MRKGIDLGIRTDPFSSGRIELDELDPSPKRAKCQPQIAFGVLRDCGVYRVVIFAWTGLDHDSAVRPGILRIGWVESWIGGQGDSRGVLAESGNRIVKQIPIGEVDDIRCPKVAEV